MLVNNETGVLQPIEDISKYAKNTKRFLLGHEQALGKMDIQQAVAYVDFASFLLIKLEDCGVGRIHA